MTATHRLPGTLHVAPTPTDVADAAARWLHDLCGESSRTAGRFTIALAGGSTPKALYSLLAQPRWAEAIDWSTWWCFFGDERACPADDPSSNYAMARDALLDHVPIPPHQIFRMPADAADLDLAAAAYSTTLTTMLGPTPVLDCVLLGLGENGHTASLFPGTDALQVNDAWCTRGLADYVPFDRLTLTYPALNAARNAAFLVTGPAKRQAFADVADGTAPAARVLPTDGNLAWWIDAAAEATLPR